MFSLALFLMGVVVSAVAIHYGIQGAHRFGVVDKPGGHKAHDTVTPFVGGLGILAIHLQDSRGWRAGKLQMAADCAILASAVFVRDPLSVALSILGALALNLVIAVNHKAGRYMGI